MTDFALEAIFKRDNAVVAAALLALTLLAWLALLAGAGTGMDPLAMSAWLLPLGGPAAQSWTWTPFYWLIAFFMWAIMMVAMMLPSASPTVLLYGRVVRQAERKGQITNARGSVAAFAAGYLTLWSLFSVFAVAVQWALERSGAMNGMMALREPVIAAACSRGWRLQLTSLKKLPTHSLPAPSSALRPGTMSMAHGARPWHLLRRLLRRPDAASLRGGVMNWCGSRA